MRRFGLLYTQDVGGSSPSSPFQIAWAEIAPIYETCVGVGSMHTWAMPAPPILHWRVHVTLLPATGRR